MCGVEITETGDVLFCVTNVCVPDLPVTIELDEDPLIIFASEGLDEEATSGEGEAFSDVFSRGLELNVDSSLNLSSNELLLSRGSLAFSFLTDLGLREIISLRLPFSSVPSIARLSASTPTISVLSTTIDGFFPLDTIPFMPPLLAP